VVRWLDFGGGRYFCAEAEGVEDEADPIGALPFGSALLQAIVNAAPASVTPLIASIQKRRFMRASILGARDDQYGAARYGNVVPLAASVIAILSPTLPSSLPVASRV